MSTSVVDVRTIITELDKQTAIDEGRFADFENVFTCVFVHQHTVVTIVTYVNTRDCMFSLFLVVCRPSTP